jgi:hypothetical protein
MDEIKKFNNKYKENFSNRDCDGVVISIGDYVRSEKEIITGEGIYPKGTKFRCLSFAKGDSESYSNDDRTWVLLKSSLGFVETTLTHSGYLANDFWLEFSKIN